MDNVSMDKLSQLPAHIVDDDRAWACPYWKQGRDSSVEPVWSHTDYRKWLRSWLEAERARRPSMVSSRWMALRLAIDPSLFSKILAGERHLAPSRVEPVCDLAGLEGDEAEYFRLLVQYARSKGHREAQACFQKMTQLRKVSPVPLQGIQSAYWEKWENVAIRELMSTRTVEDDPESIGRKLRPPVAARRVRQALSTLQDLGLASKDANGVWHRTEPFLRDGPEVDPEVLRHFHRQNLLMAAEAIEAVPKELRDFSSLTFTLPPDGYARIVELLRDFRTKVLATIAGMETSPDRVYQLGFHLVPRALPDEPSAPRGADA